MTQNSVVDEKDLDAGESTRQGFVILLPSRILEGLWIENDGPGRMLLYCGLLCSTIIGILPGCGSIFIGSAVSALAHPEKLGDIDNLSNACTNILIISVIGFFLIAISAISLEGVANRNVRRLRLRRLGFIFTQEAAFWDLHSPATFLMKTDTLINSVR
eukprot:Blabericola_migrator_1__8404@NODE_437_length_8486_cov_74_294215_g343_i0_p6_GENE_NODE_437_length_8486_cov_74_294215_g343_i0NODE_437_length_8486_cov_74_294215_g343_i0_p6_ORF_typecomplete_len159_score15_82ABC_membrane/PF00664_23/5_2e05Spec3/PF15795_5/0_074_NODE_437_length_8486_cov_74_294215_g343_i040654541